MRIKDQLIKRISENIGEEYYKDIKAALDASMVDGKLQDMLQEREIDLVDKNNQKLLDHDQTQEINTAEL